MKKLDKMAQQDAYEWGLAQMFFGEGAGTRRKLVAAKIDQRVLDIPGYEKALDEAYAKLDQTEMAEKAVALRKRIDRAHGVNKNVRALRRGNFSGVSNGVFLAVGLYYVARTTGADKVIAQRTKETYAKAKAQFDKHRNTTVVNLFQNNDGTV